MTKSRQKKQNNAKLKLQDVRRVQVRFAPPGPARRVRPAGERHFRSLQLAAAPVAPAAPRRRAGRLRLAVGLAAVLCLCALAFGLLWGFGVLGGAQPLTAVPAPAPQMAPQMPPDTGEYRTEDILEQLAPSLVSVEIYQKDGLSPQASGSGIVYSADGYILTNAHVVHQAFSIRVVFQSGAGYTASVVGSAPDSDLAVLKINAKNLTPAVFADSQQLRLGQRVIAIGNVAGMLPGSPSQGILSGLNRELTLENLAGGSIRLTLLQTDAAINPGNSGGALVDGWGRVVGINVAKLEDDHIDNIGFAIPAHIALPVVQSLIEGAYIPEKALLGVSVLALNETTGPPQGLPAQGLYIVSLTEDSGLLQWGVAAGDVILRANGQDMHSTEALVLLIEGLRPGDMVSLEVWLAATGEVITVEPELYLAKVE